VILLDANLLVYARAATLPQYAAAREWLDHQLSGTGRVGLPWQSLLAFVRIMANPRVFERAEPVSHAWRQVEEWLDQESVWIPMPTDRHREALARLFEQAAWSPNLVPDAHLAALAIEHGLTLCSTDGDFARFPELRWENPLRARG
jgi:uncharacterized protein